MLSRLRISQRLSLLLVVPIGATVVIGVPAVVDRIDQARAAAAIAGSVADARVVAGLIGDLQQERLLSVAYLASPSVRRASLVNQQSSTTGRLTYAREAVAGPTVDELRGQLDQLGDLTGHRRAVLDRLASADQVWSAYGDAIRGLIDALGLTDQPEADAPGVRQTEALDALLRASEQSSQANACLLLVTMDPQLAASLASRARLLGAAFQDRFVGLAATSHVALLDQALTGASSARAERLLADVTARRPVPLTVEEGLSLAQHDADLRGVVHENVERAIADGAAERAAGARAGAVAMAAVTAGLILAVMLLGLTVTRSVSRPLRRVTVAANTIADLAGRAMVQMSRADETDDRPPRLAALTLRSADEIGELASAFNRVQATAALLMEQQVATRRNVATMFGNIAHRTQSLASRQLVQIDELERDERDERRLASLYRLDHLTARLRRSADSLLVIAGTRDSARQTVPQPLSDVVRSAIAEIEGYQNVALRHIDHLILTAAVVPDLILLLAELVENATSFSPPDVLVEVSSTRIAGGSCVVRVVDHGIGMTAQRLEQENQRLVAAERIDVTPTSMLGLFVVGRIARRHGIDVRLSATPVSGITAEVSIPAQLQLPEQPAPMDDRAAQRASPIIGQPGPTNASPWTTATSWAGPAPWSGRPEPTGAAPGLNGGRPESQGRGGLRRREPGRSLPPGARSAAPAPNAASAADPDAERAALDAFAAGTARADAQGTARADAQATARADAQVGDGRHGLRRREPGANLAADIRHPPGRHRPPEERGHNAADADAERHQMRAYLDGLARAEEPDSFRTNPWSRR